MEAQQIPLEVEAVETVETRVELVQLDLPELTGREDLTVLLFLTGL